MQHPFLSLVSLCQGSATVALLGDWWTDWLIQENPNLAALATIFSGCATIFAAVVAWRHPRRKSRRTRDRKTRRNHAEENTQVK